MICNDSVTVATEVPVYMDEMDIEHMQDVLGFRIPFADIAARPLVGTGADIGNNGTENCQQLRDAISGLGR